MNIKWLGHSCFIVTLENGAKVLFDPYDKTVGYKISKINADAVLISHSHFDHNDLSYVCGNYTVFDKPGSYTLGDLAIEGYKTWHDCEQGKLRGDNTVFMLFADGLRVCHLGDLGCVPEKAVLEKLKGAEIVMVPVGGNYTIDAKQALDLCDMISPNIIIPMHFKTSAINIDIAPLQDFLELARSNYDISHLGKCQMDIDKSSLKKRTRIMVMEYL